MIVDGGDSVIQNRSSETIIGENENNVGSIFYLFLCYPYVQQNNKFDFDFDSKTTTQPDAPRRSSRVRKAVDRYGAVPYS